VSGGQHLVQLLDSHRLRRDTRQVVSGQQQPNRNLKQLERLDNRDPFQPQPQNDVQGKKALAHDEPPLSSIALDADI
jgi:hypothetical protein